jgi:DNA-binding response OmpR family regulator
MWQLTPEPTPDTCCVSFADDIYVRREAEERRRRSQFDRSTRRAAYLFKMGRVPVTLSNVEFRILMFLAARPYHAFTRRHIAEAVTTARQPVAEETLDRYIASLRGKLGMFRDYVQSVPYIGYRFKA